MHQPRPNMINLLLRFYRDRFLSRWTVLLFDVFTTLLALIASIALRFNFSVEQAQRVLNLPSFIGVLALYTFGYIAVGSHKGILRHTSLDDVKKVLKSSGWGFGLALIVTLSLSFAVAGRLFPLSILTFHFALTTLGLIGIRLVAKSIYIAGTHQKINFQNVLIFGSGDSGIMTKNALQQEQKGKYRVVAFADDNANRWGKKLQNIPILSPLKALSESWLAENKIELVVIAIQSISPIRRNEISEGALKAGVKVKVVPSYRTWIDGSLTSKQLKSIKIEDLLQRNKIELDNVNISGSVEGKTVLVTGAAGSIGSEIARQLSFYNLKNLILIDHAESPLYDIEQELKENCRTKKTINPICEVANVKDRYRMDTIFDNYRPDIVYHAAAYKHVPIIEKSPYEGIFVNVFGTRIVADTALRYGVERFVMVSTDKAVNPTNVMGATKRVAELYTQSLNELGKTKFIATRFGNVLGSNGSVVPLFRKQIENGGPITVTHEEITRYFMTIPEACNLVLEAGAMGQGGEVFVFDMGEPVKIIDMAKKMVKLSGLEIDKDISIEITGLRPGEKLYEELLASSENTLPTHHPKIMVAKVETYSNKSIQEHLDILTEIMIDGDVVGMVRKVKSIVPEYISQNSEFEALD
ncbi:polysaccharide biosynthesis protein [Schleiferiaceae bacterium]|nr:polysaccharide biosynthesis protein [Schleiferiaceae bacterium]